MTQGYHSKTFFILKVDSVGLILCVQVLSVNF